MTLLGSIVHPLVLWTGCEVGRDSTMMNKAPTCKEPLRAPCAQKGVHRRGQVIMGVVWEFMPVSHSPLAL